MCWLDTVHSHADPLGAFLIRVKPAFLHRKMKERRFTGLSRGFMDKLPVRERGAAIRTQGCPPDFLRQAPVWLPTQDDLDLPAVSNCRHAARTTAAGY